MLAWGISWTNMKILNEYMKTEQLVFLRYLITTVSSFFVVIFFKQNFTIDKKSLFIALFAGLITTVYTIMIFIGTRLGTASLAGAFINTLAPINTFLIMALVFKRKIFKMDIIALFLGFIGTALIMGVWHFEATKIFTKFNLIFIVAAWLWAILTVVSSLSKKLHPVVFSFYVYLFVAIFSSIFVDFTSYNFSQTDLKFWVNMLCMSIISTSLATSIFFLGVERIGSAETSSFMFIVPFSSIGFGAFFLNEYVSLWTITGTTLSIVAVCMLNKIGIFKK